MLQKFKYFGINLRGYVQDLCAENDSTPVQVIKGDLNEWRATPHPQTGRLNVIRMLTLPKFIKLNSDKNPSRIFFNRRRQDDSTINTERQKTANTILKKKNKMEGITLSQGDCLDMQINDIGLRV